MRLDPPDLGQVRVQMSIVRGVVSADFQASTSQAHVLLEKSLGTLRKTLESQGLTVERLIVSNHTSSTTQFSTRHDGDSHFSNQQRDHHDAAGNQSRGRREHTPEHPRHHSMADFLNEFKQFSMTES